jgi:hypothetical protein
MPGVCPAEVEHSPPQLPGIGAAGGPVTTRPMAFCRFPDHGARFTGRYRPEGARCADSSTAPCRPARTPASTRGSSPGCMRGRCPAGLHRPGLARSSVPHGSGHAATASTRTPLCGSPRWVSRSCSAGGPTRGSPTCCRHSVRASPASLRRPGRSWWYLIRTGACSGGRAARPSADKPIASDSWRARPGTRTVWAPTPSAPRWSHAAACRSSRRSTTCAATTCGPARRRR